MANKRIMYSEPESYFPKETRKKYKLGEYAEGGNKGTKKKKTATPKKKTK